MCTCRSACKSRLCVRLTGSSQCSYECSFRLHHGVETVGIAKHATGVLSSEWQPGLPGVRCRSLTAESRLAEPTLDRRSARSAELPSGTLDLPRNRYDSWDHRRTSPVIVCTTGSRIRSRTPPPSRSQVWSFDAREYQIFRSLASASTRRHGIDHPQVRATFR